MESFAENELIKEEVKVRFSDDSVIYGEIDKLRGCKYNSIVVLFHGSGKSDRHSTVEMNGQVVSRNFDNIAERILESGCAVFRYDKRGYYDIEKIILDAEEVMKYVSNISEFKNIIIYGWSQGAYVAVEMYRKFPKVKGFILHSGLLNGWSQYFSYILKTLTLPKLKELDKDNDGILNISDFNFYDWKSNAVTFALMNTLIEYDENKNIIFKKNIDPENRGLCNIYNEWFSLVEKIIDNPTYLRFVTSNPPKDNWKGCMDIIQKINVPILAIHGLNDGWISPEESINIKSYNSENVTLKLLPNMGHCLSRTKSVYDDIGGVIEDEALNVMMVWLDDMLNKEIKGVEGCNEQK